MVTRNIKANTATQVNSNLIGVLVHPNTNITVTVDDIVVDYTYTKFVITNGVPNPVHPEKYSKAFTDNNNNVYWYTGEIFDIDAETIYYKYILWPQVDTADDNSVWLKSTTNPGPDSSLFKIDRTDSGNPVITDAGITVGSPFIFSNYSAGSNLPFIHIGENTVSNPTLGFNYYVDGDFLIDTHNGYKVGYVVSGPAVFTDPNVTFTKGNVEEGYQTWTNENYVSEGIGTLYTPTDSPAVGDKALFTLFEAKYEYNSQTIKSINTTETPGVTDPVNCKLSYSVDGRTWTDWPEIITDDNNVISNIPRYMYLKFSQDVVITEE